MKIAIYGRVSTSEQSCENQLLELREYASARNFEVVEEYCDKGVSGSKDSRPALNKLMEAAKQRRFDAILVWRLDRWGRSIQHLVTSINDLKAFGVEFISFKDGLDLSTPSGRLQFHVIAAMAEFEKAMIVERTRAGLRRARREGKRLGRPPEAELDIERIRKMRRDGMTFRAIATKLGWSPALIHKQLKTAK